MRSRRSRDMDPVHAGMLSQVFPHVRATVDDTEKARTDERAQRPLQQRPEPLVHRVHLEHTDSTLVEQLSDDVRDRKARHVPGPEHDSDTGLGAAVLVELRLRLDRPFWGPRRHPAVAGRAPAPPSTPCPGSKPDAQRSRGDHPRANGSLPIGGRPSTAIRSRVSARACRWATTGTGPANHSSALSAGRRFTPVPHATTPPSTGVRRPGRVPEQLRPGCRRYPAQPFRAGTQVLHRVIQVRLRRRPGAHGRPTRTQPLHQSPSSSTAARIRPQEPAAPIARDHLALQAIPADLLLIVNAL